MYESFDLLFLTVMEKMSIGQILYAKDKKDILHVHSEEKGGNARGQPTGLDDLHVAPGS